MSNETEKRGRGRPPKYRAEFAEQAFNYALLGATDADLARFFDVNELTINRWKNDHPEFCKALKAGKETADAKVARSLYHRALGYEHQAVKIFMPAGADAPVYAPYTERYPPDTTAGIFWLKNRRKEDWRDAQVHDVSGEIAVGTIKRVIVRAGYPDGGGVRTAPETGEV